MANESTRDNRGQSKNAAKTPDAKATKKKQPHRWRLLTMLATLGVIVWFCRSSSRKRRCWPGAENATSDLNGSVSVKSASLGWLSPLEIRDVEVKDKLRQDVLRSPR